MMLLEKALSSSYWIILISEFCDGGRHPLYNNALNKQNEANWSLENRVYCASEWGKLPLLIYRKSVHVCDACKNLCMHAPGGAKGGAEFEGYGQVGYCKGCSVTVQPDL